MFKILELSRISQSYFKEQDRYKELRKVNDKLQKPISVEYANLSYVFDAIDIIAKKVVSVYEKHSGNVTFNKEAFISEIDVDIDKGIDDMPMSPELDAFFTRSQESYSNLLKINDLLKQLLSMDLDAMNSLIIEMHQFLLAFEAIKHSLSEYNKIDEEQLAVAAKVNDLRNVITKCSQLGHTKLANDAYEILLDVLRVKNADLKTKEDKCPFGLDIPKACNIIGESVYDLYVLDDVDESLQGKAKKINEKICNKNIRKDKVERCIFADKIMDDSVICNFGEPNAGMNSVGFGSNISGQYPMMWSGLFTMPLGWGFSGTESFMSRTPGTSSSNIFGLSPGYTGAINFKMKKLAMDLHDKNLKDLARKIRS